jgi:signal transduction histidine kinase
VAAGRLREDLEALLDAVSQSAAWPAAMPDGRPVDVIRVMEGALRLIEDDPEFRRLAVALRPEAPAAWADVHPAGLVLVTLHLAAGARDAAAGAEPPQLFIDVADDAGRITLEYQDNGEGLDPADLSCVFAPFVPPRTGRRCRGGVGMATCQELVRFMGGRIRLRSRPDQGATVVITLPAAAPPA